MSGSQGNVTLDTIAGISMDTAPSEINRLERGHNASITLDLNGRTAARTALTGMLRSLTRGR